LSLNKVQYNTNCNLYKSSEIQLSIDGKHKVYGSPLLYLNDFTFWRLEFESVLSIYEVCHKIPVNKKFSTSYATSLKFDKLLNAIDNNL